VKPDSHARPPLAQPIRAVVFDLDGVEVQTEPLNWKSWREFLEPLGHEFGLDDYRAMIGMGASEHIIRERYKVEMPIEDLIADHRRRLIALLETDLVVTPAAIETICEIKERGRLVAVATNSPFEYAERVLQLSGRSLLDTLVTAKDASQPKPAPDVYLVAAARLGVPPSNCLAVEDSPPG